MIYIPREKLCPRLSQSCGGSKRRNYRPETLGDIRDPSSSSSSSYQKCSHHKYTISHRYYRGVGHIPTASKLEISTNRSHHDSPSVWSGADFQWLIHRSYVLLLTVSESLYVYSSRCPLTRAKRRTVPRTRGHRSLLPKIVWFPLKEMYHRVIAGDLWSSLPLPCLYGPGP